MIERPLASKLPGDSHPIFVHMTVRKADCAKVRWQLSVAYFKPDIQTNNPEVKPILAAAHRISVAVVTSAWKRHKQQVARSQMVGGALYDDYGPAGAFFPPLVSWTGIRFALRFPIERSWGSTSGKPCHPIEFGAKGVHMSNHATDLMPRQLTACEASRGRAPHLRSAGTVLSRPHCRA